MGLLEISGVPLGRVCDGFGSPPRKCLWWFFGSPPVQGLWWFLGPLWGGTLTWEQDSSSFMMYWSKIWRLLVARSSSESSFSYFLIWGQGAQCHPGAGCKAMAVISQHPRGQGSLPAATLTTHRVGIYPSPFLLGGDRETPVCLRWHGGQPPRASPLHRTPPAASPPPPDSGRNPGTAGTLGNRERVRAPEP